ncbi:hypothetical protein MHW47_31055, partial [Streptomyces sp. OfavH-34-F]|uniref:hypothetical protein n=1 Tax=Streptomyces sp. OfavH-34-F TaxID=2917760 RepID=UPI001EF20EB5
MRIRDSHRADAERLLARAVEEEARRAGGGADAALLLSRARAALDSIAAGAEEEYAAYVRALDASAEGRRLRRESLATPLLVTGVAAVAAFGADVALG